MQGTNTHIHSKIHNKDYKDNNWHHEAEFYTVFSKDALAIFYSSVIFLFLFFWLLHHKSKNMLHFALDTTFYSLNDIAY